VNMPRCWHERLCWRYRPCVAAARLPTHTLTPGPAPTPIRAFPGHSCHSRFRIRAFATSQLTTREQHFPKITRRYGVPFAHVVLPFCSVVLRAQKPLPEGYPANPKIIGEHIRKRRLDLRLSQKEVGEAIGVAMETVRQWESGRNSPAVRLMPKVVAFLGHPPVVDTGKIDGARIKACRKLLGLTGQEAAERLGICASTLSSWENGEAIKKRSYASAIESLITSAARVGATAILPAQSPRASTSSQTR
jgi:transcriptional regulator with XRE-family HTH domain